MPEPTHIVFCHCSFAQVVPPAVKEAVLRDLCGSGQPFHAVADLCEMVARRDPTLKQWAAGGSIKIAACYPRAVKWLFASAGAALRADRTEVLNMRVAPAEDVSAALRRPEVEPNLPAGSPDPPSAAERPPEPSSTGS